MTNQYAISEVKLTYQTKVKASERPQIRCSTDIYSILINAVFDNETIEHRESLKMILLNQANKVLGVHHISEGGISGTTADLRLIMQAALLANSSGIILAHNHPSGNLTPSGQDDQMTRKVQKACEFMDIKFLDHLVITTEGFYSYADEGRL